MLTIRGVYDGKSVKILPGEPVPVAQGDVPVIITFLEAQLQPSPHGESLDEASLDEIEADEARWDKMFDDSSEQMLAMAREARAVFLAGNTTGIEVVDGELKPVGDCD